MEIPIHTIDEYRNISSDVWNIFKKNFDVKGYLNDLASDIHEIDQKYNPNPRLHEFQKKLTVLYMTELAELKQQELRREKEK